MEIKFQLGTFIIMMINFIILMVVLIRFLYRPIQGIIEQRRQKITQDLNDAQQAKEKSDQLRHEAKIVLEESHVEAYEIVERARNEAEKLREELLTQARKEIDQLRHRSQLELERAKSIAREEIRDEAVSLALSAVQKVLTDHMTKDLNESLIRNVLEQMEKGELNK